MYVAFLSVPMPLVKQISKGLIHHYTLLCGTSYKTVSSLHGLLLGDFAQLYICIISSDVILWLCVQMTLTH